mgnify:CR=1 FL=1
MINQKETELVKIVLLLEVVKDLDITPRVTETAKDILSKVHEVPLISELTGMGNMVDQFKERVSSDNIFVCEVLLHTLRHCELKNDDFIPMETLLSKLITWDIWDNSSHKEIYQIIKESRIKNKFKNRSLTIRGHMARRELNNLT